MNSRCVAPANTIGADGLHRRDLSQQRQAGFPGVLPLAVAASAMTIAAAPATAASEPVPTTRVLKSFDRRRLKDVERLALRDALFADRSGELRLRDRAPRACARSIPRAVPLPMMAMKDIDLEDSRPKFD